MDRAECSRTHHPAVLRFDQRSAGPVHLVVEPAGVAEVIAVAVPPPERGDGGEAVDALPALLGVARCGRGGGEAAHRGGQLRRAGRAHRDGQGGNLTRLRLRGGGELHHAAGILRQRDLRRGEEGEDRRRGVGGGGGQQEGGKGRGGRKVLQSRPRPASSDQPLECCEGGVGQQLGRLCGAGQCGAGRGAVRLYLGTGGGPPA